MGRAVTTIRTEEDRNKVSQWAFMAPNGTRVEFKEVKRSLPQNDRMWAMLADVAEQVEWDGARRPTPEWKDLFMDWLPRELRTLSALDGSGRQVPIGRSTSDLSKEEMSNLIELIAMFGVNHGVKFKDDE